VIRGQISYVDRTASLNIPRKEQVENRYVSTSLCTDIEYAEECIHITLNVSEYQQYTVKILEDAAPRNGREQFLMEMRQECPFVQHKLQHASNSPGDNTAYNRLSGIGKQTTAYKHSYVMHSKKRRQN
jgi:hypothetical protein